MHPALRFCRGVLSSVYARPCGSVAVFCHRFTLGLVVLLRRFAFGFARHHGSVAVFCHRFTLGLAVLLRRFAFGLRLSFSRCEKETACDVLRSYSTGSRSPFVRSRAVLGLSAFVGSLRVCAFFLWRSRRVTGVRRTGLGAGGAAFVPFCVVILVLKFFPRGVRWGCAPQTCAKESSTLWTLFTLRRGCVGAYSQRLCVFAQPHWLCCAFCGEYAGATRPKPAPKSRMWKRHCRLSGLSSRCGGAVLVRIRSAYASLRSHIGFAALSVGSTLGLNVEAALLLSQTAPKSRMWKRHCRLSGLSSRCGGVVLVRIRRACAYTRRR